MLGEVSRIARLKSSPGLLFHSRTFLLNFSDFRILEFQQLFLGGIYVSLSKLIFTQKYFLLDFTKKKNK